MSVGWDEGKSDATVEAVKSLGWLMDTNETQVILGADMSLDPQGTPFTNRRIAIPIAWIKSIKEITV